MSPCSGLVRNEGRTILQHAMEHDSELAGERRARLAGTHSPGNIERRDLEVRPVHRARQNDIRRFVQRRPDAHVANLEDVTAAIDLSRLIFLPRQAKMVSDVG